MGEFAVRPATPADLEAAAELLAEMARIQAGWRVFEPRPGMLQDTLARLRGAQEDPDSLHLVAEEDGRVVGMALATVHRPSGFSDDRSVELSSVIVRPSHRGRGVGRAMIQEAASFALARGVRVLDLRVFSQNEDAVAFWRRLGFRPRFVQMVAEAQDLAPGDRADR